VDNARTEALRGAVRGPVPGDVGGRAGMLPLPEPAEAEARWWTACQARGSQRCGTVRSHGGKPVGASLERDETVLLVPFERGKPVGKAGDDRLEASALVTGEPRIDGRRSACPTGHSLIPI